MTDDRRAPVQGEARIRPGSIEWAEHVEAWHGYAKRFPGAGAQQNADVIADRGGFGYGELVAFLGHLPRTWQAR